MAAAAELRAQGLVENLGFAEKDGVDLVIPSIGWRWEFTPAERVAGWGRAIGCDLSYVVEPQIGVVLGDRDTAEVQVVPMVRLEPLALREAIASPFLEAGIGLVYTGLDGLGLGSHFLFSDNVGVGARMALPERWPFERVSLGYRYRHISHAGIFGSPNSGLNTHYLTVTFE